VISGIAISLLLLSLQHAKGSVMPDDCPEYDTVAYSTPDGAQGAITVMSLDRGGTPTLRGADHKSPYATASFRMQEPLVDEPAGAETVIEVMGNKARALHLRIGITDYMTGVRVKWINEKLLSLQAWRGRISSTDAILDVDTGTFLYKEDASYGSFIVPCRMKRGR
jgi:hypothetical protein